MTDWPNIEVCDPNHPESIGAAIAKQMAKPQDNQLVEKVMDHTWERTGERIRTVYEQALAIPRGTEEKSLLPEPPSSTLRLFSESQREETLFLAFLLPAWRQLENGDVSSARQNLEGLFRLGNDRAFLSELLVRSAAEHAAQLAVGSSPHATSMEFADNLLSALSPPPELESHARGELYAQMAFTMFATGQRRKAAQLVWRSFIRDGNKRIPLRLFTIGLERALGLQLSEPYRSAKALALPLYRGSDRDPGVRPR
jgi:hypothetical protein